MEQLDNKTPQSQEILNEEGTSVSTPSDIEQLKAELEAQKKQYKELQSEFTKTRQKMSEKEKQEVFEKYGLNANEKYELPEEIKDLVDFAKRMKEDEQLNSLSAERSIDQETKTKVKEVLKKYPSMDFDDALVLATSTTAIDEAKKQVMAQEEAKRLAASRTFANASTLSVDEEVKALASLSEAQLRVIKKSGITPEQYVKRMLNK